MGNTTSERVSGERHGSKSQRSDGSGASHPAKEHPHKIMVGSTDDPSVFSSHDSKVGAACCLPLLPCRAWAPCPCGAVLPAMPGGAGGALWCSCVWLVEASSVNVFIGHVSLVFFAQIPGDKEFVSWQPDLEESVKPSQQARPTVIRWADGGKEVFISGSFNNWSTKIPLIKR